MSDTTISITPDARETLTDYKERQDAVSYDDALRLLLGMNRRDNAYPQPASGSGVYDGLVRVKVTDAVHGRLRSLKTETNADTYDELVRHLLDMPERDTGREDVIDYSLPDA